MAVKIGIKLKDHGVEEKILGIAGALETLEDASEGDFDIDEIDLGGMADEIGNVAEALDDLEVNADRINRKVNKAAEKWKGMDGTEIQIAHKRSPDGSTGSGDSTGADPPSQLSRKYGQLVGEDVELFEDIDTKKLDEIANDLETTTQNLDIYRPESDTWQTPSGRDHPDLDSMDWGELRKEASRVDNQTDANIYPQGASGETLKSNLRDYYDSHSELSLWDMDKPSEMDWGTLQKQASAVNAYPQDAGKEKLRENLKPYYFGDTSPGTRTESHGLTSVRRRNEDIPELADLPDKHPTQTDLREKRFRKLIENSPALSGDVDDLKQDIKGTYENARLDIDRVKENVDSKNVRLDLDDINGDIGEDLTERQRDTYATIHGDQIDADDDLTKSGVGRATGPQDRVPLWSKAESDDGPHFGFKRPDLDLDDIDSKDLKKAKNRFSGLGSGVKRLIPDMHQFRSVIAALIPVALVLGTQLLGVASAMGAVAVAGASIMALGLAGHGENMEQSFANAKERLNDLKKDLFEVAQPTMQLFAPIQDRAFEAIPGRVDDIAESMEGLIAYEGTLFQLGGMLSEGMEDAFEAIAENEDGISQLALRFGELAGSAVFDFFGFLYREARDNQQMLVNLGGTLKDLLKIVFRVFKALLLIANAFSPITSILLWVSELLNTKVGKALTVFIGVAYLTVSALTKLGLAALWAFSKIAAVASAGFINTMKSAMAGVQASIARLISHYTALSGAAASAYASMAAVAAMTGIGLLGIAAGGYAVSQMSHSGDTGGPSGYGGGGSGRTVVNDNRSFEFNTQGGEMDYATKKWTENQIGRYDRATQAQNLPDVETGGS